MLSNLHPQISDSSILIGRGSDVVNFDGELWFVPGGRLVFLAFRMDAGFASRINVMQVQTGL